MAFLRGGSEGGRNEEESNKRRISLGDLKGSKTYNRLSLSRNRKDPQKQFEISVLRHIRFVVLRIKQFEQPIFTNDYVI